MLRHASLPHKTTFTSPETITTPASASFFTSHNRTFARRSWSRTISLFGLFLMLLRIFVLNFLRRFIVIFFMSWRAIIVCHRILVIFIISLVTVINFGPTQVIWLKRAGNFRTIFLYVTLLTTPVTYSTIISLHFIFGFSRLTKFNFQPLSPKIQT